MELWLGSEESAKKYTDLVKAGPPEGWKPSVKCSAFKSQQGLPAVAQAAASTAIIKITGTLIAGEAGWMRMFGMLGYEEIKAAVYEVMTSDNYDSVVFYVDSPGGAVNGLQSTLSAMTQLAKMKPSAVYAANACSAAYWLSSGAGPIVADELSMLGSVGAVIQLRNVVKAMEEEGVKVHTFKSGNLKMAGNPYEELTDEAKEHYQKLVDANADIFIKNVAAARGIGSDKLKKSVGDGRTMLAREALQNRLIDKIGTLSDALKIVQTDVKRRSRAR